MIESCNPISQIDETNGKLVAAQIDLQFGFAGKFVNIKFNSQDYFQAYLEMVSPFAGPEAKFSTFLPRGKNMVNINGRYLENWDRTFEFSTDYELGYKTKYFIGAVMGKDSIHVEIQDRPFGYY